MRVYAVMIDENNNDMEKNTNFEYNYLSDNLDDIDKYLSKKISKDSSYKLNILINMGACILYKHNGVTNFTYLIDIDFPGHNNLLDKLVTNLKIRIKRDNNIDEILNEE